MNTNANIKVWLHCTELAKKVSATFLIVVITLNVSE